MTVVVDSGKHTEIMVPAGVWESFCLAVDFCNSQSSASSFLTESTSSVSPETKDDLEQLTAEIKKRANNVRNKLKSKKGTQE